MSLSDYTQEKLLKHLFGLGAFTVPTLYVGLSTANPGANGAGNAEPAGGAYARVATIAANWTWNATPKRIENAATLTFPTPTAPWGTVTYMTLWDAATGGNMIDYTALATAKTVGTGEAPFFDVGQMTFDIVPSA